MTRQISIDPDLEYQYNNMARRPDAPGLLQRWVERSEEYRRNAEATLDCSYGSGEWDRIDVFRCGENEAPLYVYIHGGYWQRGDKSMYSFIAEPFNAAGVDVAIIGYPLCPQVSMTRLVGKIVAALAWLYRNASSVGLCARRINLSGHSAGGHLTAMGLTTDWPDLGDDLPRDLIKTGIALSGLYRLESLLPTTISDVLNLTTVEIDDLSPVNLAAIDQAPIMLVVGGGETGEFFAQADSLIDSWSRPGLVIETYIEPGVDHFDLVNRLADPASELFRCAKAWLK